MEIPLLIMVLIGLVVIGVLQVRILQRPNHDVEVLSNDITVDTSVMDAKLDALTASVGGLNASLSNNTMRGAWGERSAEDALERFGMTKGTNYLRSTAIKDIDSTLIPDFSIMLPDNYIHMDVKTPLGEGRELISSARAHVRDLISRGYHDTPKSLPFTLMYVPVESICREISTDIALMDEAWSNDIYIVGPWSLVPLLSLVHDISESLIISEESKARLAELESFRNQWEKMSDAQDKVRKQFATLGKSIDDMTGTRTRMLDRVIDRVLGRLRSDDKEEEEDN